MTVLTTARRAASTCFLPLARRAAKAYVAGENLDDALIIARRATAIGQGFCLGYWDGAGDTPQGIVEHHLQAVEALAAFPRGYLSIKVPALGYDRVLVGEIVDRAQAAGVRVHFDAHGTETSDATRSLFESLLTTGVRLSYTLPARWQRSLSDADWACEIGVQVRVVKGQFPDAAHPNADLRASYLALVDRLAGRARHVSLASHDVPLVDECVARLRAANTPCNLELLFGLPMRGSQMQAKRLGLDVAIYVPYGKSYLPYAMSRLLREPRMALWLGRDLLASGLNR